MKVYFLQRNVYSFFTIYFNKFISISRFIIPVLTEEPSCKCKGTTSLTSGPGSSVIISTGYGLYGTGIESWWDEFFRPSRPALWPTQPPVKWVPAFSPGVKCGGGVLLTTRPLLVLWSCKSKAIPPPTLSATPGM